METKKKKKYNLIQLMCEIDFHEFQLAKAIDQIAIICYFLTFHFTKYSCVNCRKKELNRNCID